MPNILSMTKEQLIKLQPEQVTRLLTTEEIVYMAKTLDAFWAYDYEAAEQGRPGMHAELKSLLHSDGFFISRIMLQYPNIRKIMANQQAMRIRDIAPKPEWVAGVPDGATELGEDLAEMLGAKVAKMVKVDGKIVLVSEIGPDETLLLCEDFCTRGTGFKEAATDIFSKQPRIRFLYYEVVIINRGGLKEIVVEGVGTFVIVAVAEHRINDWPEEECPPCKMGSIAIKPKATDENWQLITTSQFMPESELRAMVTAKICGN